MRRSLRLRTTAVSAPVRRQGGVNPARAIILHRPYFYCDGCERGFHPLDATLQLSAKHHQFDVQERTTRLGADLPFGLSADQFAHLTGISTSPHFIHDTLNAVGEAATMDRVIPDAAEVSRRIDEARGTSRRRPVLVVACDGAMAPTRPPGGRRKKRGKGEWHEAKGVRVYLLGKEQNHTRSCVPGRLAYFDGEEPGDRWILWRP